MNSYQITFLKKTNSSYLSEKATSILALERVGIKKLLIRNTQERFTLKIKKQKASKFIRIPMKHYSLKNIWFAQFPTNNDIILLTNSDVTGELRSQVFPHQWKYRFVLLNIIS